MTVGETVRLETPTPNHAWTLELVGEDGWVSEVTEKAVAVEGLLPGVLYFAPKQLVSLERKAA